MTKHKTFSSRLGSIITIASSAIGLGNIWKFPYEVATGGGAAFLLVYLLCIVLMGYPLVLSELALGRAKGKSITRIYGADGGRWRWLGSLNTLISLCTYIFYVVVMAWLCGYIWSLLRGELLLSDDFDAVFVHVKASTGKGMAYTALLLASMGIVVSGGIRSGIERACKVLMPIFFFFLLALAIYACTFSGARKGLSFYLLPSWGNLSGRTILTALGHAFMSLSIGTGQLVTLGKAVDQKDNLPRSTAFIVFGDTLIALLAGFIIFPLIFSFPAMGEASLSKGPALVFVALPLILQQLGTWGTWVGLMFFTLLLFAGITSAISLLEVVTQYMMDNFGWQRRRAIIATSLITCVIALPCMLSGDDASFWAHIIHFGGRDYGLQELMMLLFVDVALPISALAFIFFVQRRWGKARLVAAVQGVYRQPGIADYTHDMLYYVAPPLIACILLYSWWG